MPWKVKEGGQDCPYEVVRADTGAHVACHDSRDGAEMHVKALYANEPREHRLWAPIEIRSAAIDSIDYPQRTISVIAVPYGQRTDIPYRGEVWGETVMPGAFDGIANGIEASAKQLDQLNSLDAKQLDQLNSLDGRQRFHVNRDHDVRRVVGKIVDYLPERQDGLVVDAYISKTELGDETLRLAADGVLGGSVGMAVRSSDQILDRRARTRTIRRAFLDHVALVPDPAYQGAEVIGVRNNDNTAEAKLPLMNNTPDLDELLYDPIFNWANDRIAAIDSRADTQKPYGDVKYADPGYKGGMKRYPIDTEAHVRAAWSYINMPKNQSGYTSEQVAAIKGRIKAAAKRFNIQISDE